MRNTQRKAKAIAIAQTDAENRQRLVAFSIMLLLPAALLLLLISP